MQIRLYADWVEVYYKSHLVERMERVSGEREARVNYRHVIGSLVRKPGAFVERHELCTSDPGNRQEL